MLKVMSVFGTRPEAIKMAPLVKELESSDQCQSIVCVTAQHRQMLDSVLNLFNIKSDYDLNIMQHGQTIVEITNRVLTGVDQVIQDAKPDIVLVHGDTTTTFAAALAAFYNKITVGHVEAGLRSGNIYSPYPEEINRRLSGVLASMHFAPTQGNVNNLLEEGVNAEDIFLTGNTVIDALLQVVEDEHIFDTQILNDIDYVHNKVILLTAHRRENWGEPMVQIFQAVRELVINHQDVEVVFPVHLNPKVREVARKILGDLKQIHLIEPLEYKELANLMNKCYLVLTDSGGIQEEAPALGKPVVVLRTETERPEAVAAGTAIVAGVDKCKIIEITENLLTSIEIYNKMGNAVNPYGDGKASKRIVENIYTLKQ